MTPKWAAQRTDAHLRIPATAEHRSKARRYDARRHHATTRKLALLVYRMLRHRTPYQEQSAADYDRQHRSRILRGLRKRAASLGIEVVDTTTGLVM